MSQPSWDTHKPKSREELKREYGAQDWPFPTLPTEIFVEIFKHADVVTSVCLGLTSKKMYSLHYSIHGKVTLFEPEDGWCWDRLYKGIMFALARRRTLWGLLEKWMGDDYVMTRGYKIEPQKFHRKEKLVRS